MAAHDAARRIVAPHAEDHVLRAIGRPLHPQHPAIGLVHAVTADAKVRDWLAEMAGEVLLPSLAVADLIALGEAIAVRVDPRLSARIKEARPRAVRSERLDGPAVVYSGLNDGVVQD
jgi:hypothetical protein